MYVKFDQNQNFLLCEILLYVCKYKIKNENFCELYTGCPILIYLSKNFFTFNCRENCREKVLKQLSSLLCACVRVCIYTHALFFKANKKDNKTNFTFY